MRMKINERCYDIYKNKIYKKMNDSDVSIDEQMLYDMNMALINITELLISYDKGNTIENFTKALRKQLDVMDKEYK